MKYHELRALPTGLSEPHALALGPDGARYVAGDLCVVRLGDAGTRRTMFTLAASPTCLAIGKDGMFYVGLTDHIAVYDKHGALKSRWNPAGKKAYITSIALSGDALWAADAGGRLVWRYDRAGHLLGSIGQRDTRTSAPGLVVPSPHLDVAVARDDTLWVANPGRHELEQFDTLDGRLRKTWGKAGNSDAAFSGCCNPTDFALLPDGGFVTAEKQRPRVKIYRADGAFLGFVAGPERFAPKIAGMGLAVDAKGQILVLDTAQKTVRVFSHN